MREIGKIHVIGYLDIGKVLEFSMEHHYNEHAKAYVRAELKNEGVLNQTRENSQLSICVDSEIGREILFVGNVEQISVNKRGNGYDEVEIRLVSNSILLDRKKECKSFQNVKLTYEQLVDKALCTDGNYIWNLSESPTIDRPLIQYYETKWEFLKRVASHLNAKILTDIEHTSPCIHIGSPDFGGANKINVISSRTELSKEFFRFSGRSQSEFLYHRIESEDNFEVGSDILLYNQKMTIFAKRAHTVEGRILFSYDAGGSVHTEIQTYFNKDFIGRVIKGEVLSAKNETLRIKMEIDDTQSEAEAYDYEWCPESGNLMYCMPQVGTITSLYFADWDERTGRIINCIRTNGDSCEDMSDPNNKTLTTEFGKRLIMNENSLELITDINNENSSKVSLLDNIGIKIESLENISMYARGKITIDGKHVKVIAPTEIVCAQGMNFDGTAKSTFQIEVDFNIVTGEFKCNLDKFLLYPNIQDAPEVCNFSIGGLIGRIALGLAVVAAVALVAAVFVTFGFAIAAAAGVAAATAAVAAVGYGGIMLGAFAIGAAVGTVGVGTLAVKDCMDDNLSDYEDYMKTAVADTAAAAIIGGICYPIGIAYASVQTVQNIINVIEPGATYCLTQLFKGEDFEIDGLALNYIVPKMLPFDIENLFWKNVVENAATNAVSELSPLNEKTEIVRERYTPDGTNAELSDEEKEQKIQEHEEAINEQGEEKGKDYIVRGAELRCTCGSHMRRLDINQDNAYRVVSAEYVHPYITACQCVTGETENIKNFGICSGCKEGDSITLYKEESADGGSKKDKITGVGCVPELLGDAWFDTEKGTCLNGLGELVIGKSFLACKYGGFIEIHTCSEEYKGDLDDGEITSPPPTEAVE